MLRTACRVFVFGSLLFCLAAISLEERWHVDIGPGARSLPTVVDRNGDGEQEVLLTSRFDGTIWCIDSGGDVTSRYRRSNWLEGPVAASTPIGGRSRLFTFQESSGTLSLADFNTGLNLVVDVPGDPCIGSAPCFADLNRSGRQEIVCARRNGILYALDRRLSVLWEYDARSPFDSTPVVAPVFMGAAAVFAQSTDGVVHCIDGDGSPRWRFTPQNPAAKFPSVRRPAGRRTRCGNTGSPGERFCGLDVRAGRCHGTGAMALSRRYDRPRLPGRHRRAGIRRT